MFAGRLFAPGSKLMNKSCLKKNKYCTQQTEVKGFQTVMDQIFKPSSSCALILHP